MDFIIIGLGNPTDKYNKTRHNIGRDIVDFFREKHQCDDWKFDKKKNALISKGMVKLIPVTLVLPETFMNDSGKAVSKIVSTKKKAHNTVVVYDELDVGLGKMKISYDKNSGGHKGVESIINHIKTKEFIRLRIGIAPVTASGKVKKVIGEDAVVKHVLSKFKPTEKKKVETIFENGVKALELILENDYEKAMNVVNGW